MKTLTRTGAMRKTLDRTFDLTEDGLAAAYRIRLYETVNEPGDPHATTAMVREDAERVLVTSWELRQPGLPLDAWMERMADQAFEVLHGQGGVLTLVEFFPRREYQIGEKGENMLTFPEEICMARIQPQEDGSIALLDFGETTREEIEAQIGESLTATPMDLLEAAHG